MSPQINDVIKRSFKPQYNNSNCGVILHYTTLPIGNIVGMKKGKREVEGKGREEEGGGGEKEEKRDEQKMSISGSKIPPV